MKFKLVIEAIDDKRVIWHEIIESENVVEVFARLLINQAQMFEVLKEKAIEHERQLHIDDDIPF